MKKLKDILRWSVWSLVALYALAMAATHTPVVQESLGQYVASVMSETLGTKVSVERVGLGFFNRIIIDNLHICDQKGGNLLKVGRLSAKMELIPLTKGQVSISSAQLFNAYFHASRDSAGAPMNFQFIIDSLSASPDTTHTPLNLRIGSLIIRHSIVTYDQKDKARTRGKLDPYHIKTNDVSAYIVLKTLTDDSLHVNIKRIAFSEQSGLQVKRLSMEARAGLHNARIDRLNLQLLNSSLLIDSVVATYNSQHLKETLKYKGSISNTTITIRDLAFYNESLKQRNKSLNIDAAVRGTCNSIDIPHLNIASSDNQIQLSASGWGHALDKVAEWHADLHHLNISEGTMKSLSGSIEGQPEQLSNIGHLQMSATFDGDETGYKMVTRKLSTGIGDLSLQAQMSRQQTWSGEVVTKGVNLMKLLDNEELGQMAASLKVSGNASSLHAQGAISRLDYKGYSYQNINIDGVYGKESIAGNLTIDDPNVNLAVEGTYAQDSRNKHSLQLTGFIHNIKPYALHLTKRWKDTQFKAIIDADISGNSLNNAQGTVDLDDFVMSDSLGQYVIDNIHLRSGYENDKHFLKINGDMGEAVVWGQFDWDTLPQSFVNYVASKLPTLPGLPTKRKATANDFEISVQIDNTKWLSRIFGIPLTLDKPFRMQASVDDRDLNIDGKLPMFTYNGSQYRNGSIRLTTPNGKMDCEVELTKVSDRDETTDLSLNAIAHNNQLSTKIDWDNHAPASKSWKGQLNTVMQLYNNDEGKPEAHIRLHPSHAYFDGARWNVKPCNIIYTEDYIDIQNFSVEHGQQHLFINGQVSKHPHDTLTVDMNSIDVGYIMDLINFHSVDFDGKATGSASATQLFATPHMTADLRVDDFRFQNGRMGTLYAAAKWNREKEQIDITATADDGTDAQTLVNGYVSPIKEFIDLDIEAQGSYIEFMNSFTSNFLSNVTGHARGRVRLAGPLDNINLTGQLVVDGEATVKALGTTYTLKNDTVILVPDDIQLPSVPVYDKYGNLARLGGGIHHKHLTRLTFDLVVATYKLLAYDFDNYDDGLFYGKVFVQGSADLHGRPGEVTINSNVTPWENSFFTYNATSGNSISEQEFITWNENGRQKQKTVIPLMTAQPESTTKDIPTDLYLNFTINATPDAELRILMDKRTNDYITLRGAGLLNASYHNKGAFNLYGNYTVESGTYGITIQNIIKKNFTFQQGGSIVFGGNPMEAGLNLKAIYTVNGVSLSDLGIGNSFTNNTVRVDCIMNILGQAGAPRVEFDFDMPNVNSEELQMIRSVINSEQGTNQQVLYLLGIGRFYTQGSNNASEDQQYGQTELAMQSFLSGTISTQLNEVLSQVIKNDKWNFGANISTGNEGWHNAEYEGIINGRMFNNRLLINGQFGYRDNATTASPSFIGDFDIRYLLYPNGNLALKVYNQTNDRYFTRSSLNTQGIGIIMKRDFNSLSDLLAPRRNKTKTKNKKSK